MEQLQFHYNLQAASKPPLFTKYPGKSLTYNETHYYPLCILLPNASVTFYLQYYHPNAKRSDFIIDAFYFGFNVEVSIVGYSDEGSYARAGHVHYCSNITNIIT